MDQQVEDELLDLFDEGRLNITEAAKEFGRTRSTIYRALDRARARRENRKA